MSGLKGFVGSRGATVPQKEFEYSFEKKNLTKLVKNSFYKKLNSRKWSPSCFEGQIMSTLRT